MHHFQVKIAGSLLKCRVNGARRNLKEGDGGGERKKGEESGMGKGEEWRECREGGETSPGLLTAIVSVS